MQKNTLREKMTEIKVLILAGVSGCGKSTFTNSGALDCDGLHCTRVPFTYGVKKPYKLGICSTDSYLVDYANDNNLSYQEAYNEIQEKGLFRNATAKFYSDIEDNIKKDFSFVIDRTNLTSGGRKHLIENLRNTAKAIGKSLYIVTLYFDIPIETIKERLKKRESETGKTIPEDVILQQINSLENVKHEEGHDELRIIKSDGVIEWD